MSWKRLGRDIGPILASALFVGLGILVMWVSKELLGLEGEAVLVSLLLLPTVVYTIFSGRLKEFTVLGGLSAKFADVAQQSVEVASETVELSMEIVGKAGLEELPERMGNLDETKPIVLTLVLGREGYYDYRAYQKYVKALSRYRTFRFVVVLDRQEKFVAYFPSAAMQALKSADLARFVGIVGRGDIQGLRGYHAALTRTIPRTSTNVNALKEMMDQNVEALVVVDEDRKLEGVVEREQLLSKLLLSMAT